jgi:sugar lactone lactonase YvrE
MKKFLQNTLTILAFTITVASNAQVINTFEGGGTSYANGIQATLSAVGPFRALATDAIGNIYFTTVGKIYKVSTAGILTQIAGGGTLTAEGSPALGSSIQASHGLAIDVAGNIYFSEQSNHKIKKISTSGNITTYVGTGAMGFAGDGGLATAAKLNNPIGISIDASGNLYITDTNNHRIRKVTSAGIIRSIAGNGVGGFSGDGGSATLAKINMPEGVTTDALGNVYLCDANYTVRKINTAGIINTLAGNTLVGFSGDGGPATSAQISPKAIAIDSYFNLYIADFLYHVIRKVNSAGIISTIAGQDGLSGFSGDGGNPLLALLNNPYGLLVTTDCNLYITDLSNQRIRVINGSSCYVGLDELSNDAPSIKVFPNPSSGQFNFNGLLGDNTIQVTDIMGRVLLTEKTNVASHGINLAAAQGIYFYKITDKANRLQQGKLIIN